jgi:hypothetical protein
LENIIVLFTNYYIVHACICSVFDIFSYILLTDKHMTHKVHAKTYKKPAWQALLGEGIWGFKVMPAHEETMVFHWLIDSSSSALSSQLRRP